MSTKSPAIYVVATIVAGLACSTVTAQSLSLIDLGAGTSAYGINANGEVTGCAPAGAGATHAFLYSAGVMTDLGTLGGANSCGYAINVGGEVTGYADTATVSTSHAFLYNNGTMTDLGSLGSAQTSVGVSINAHGDVVGYAWPYPPFAPLQPPGIYGAALQVTDFIDGPIVHAFRYTQGAMTDLFPSSPVFQPRCSTFDGLDQLNLKLLTGSTLLPLSPRSRRALPMSQLATIRLTF